MAMSYDTAGNWIENEVVLPCKTVIVILEFNCLAANQMGIAECA
jgi:hypothetical protein